jgi:hypothetical protein
MEELTEDSRILIIIRFIVKRRKAARRKHEQITDSDSKSYKEAFHMENI